MKLGQEQFEVLKKIQQYDPKAVIAGGAVRDYIFDKDFRDVDIFMSTKETPKFHMGLSMFIDYELENIFGDVEDLTRSLSEGYKSVSFLSFNLKSKGVLYNLIMSPKRLTNTMENTFDFTCNTIYHDGTKLYKSPLFNKFIETMTIEKLGNTALDYKHIERAMKIADKLKCKLSDNMKDDIKRYEAFIKGGSKKNLFDKKLVGSGNW